jgi:hypothetical protein
MKRILGVVALFALVAACTPAASSAPTVSASPSSSASASASVAPTATANPSPGASSSASPSASPTATPEPTTALGDFTCDLPVTLPATTDRAQITDVRVGRHGSGPTGYDRIVFEFQGQGIPEFRLRVGRPPFTFDPSGLPMSVRGQAFLVMVLQGGTGITPNGRETYTGPTTFTPRFPRLRQLRQAGDFEAVSEWVAGLGGRACYRLDVFTDPTRIVLDVQHP